ncbi:hypothetical protein Tco_1464168, partial [Tanacetum coccineum]
TQAIDEQDHLVNYNNDNENDDLGYRLEEYFDEGDEEDENNHSNGNVDIMKTQSIVFEFLGDLVREHIGLKILSWKKVDSKARDKLWDEITRYFDVDLTVRKMKETEDKIKEGTFKVDHGTDAMTVVLGKEKGGYARGVGNGVTYKRYFDFLQSRQASDEIILLLQSQLDNERHERQKRELLIQNLFNKMSQTKGMVTKLKNKLAAQEGQF